MHTRDFFPLNITAHLRKGMAHLNMGVALLFEAFILPSDEFRTSDEMTESLEFLMNL